MRSSIFLFVLIFFSSQSLQSQTKSNYTPPGTVFVKNNTYVDKLEISNKVWKEFMKFNTNSTLRDSSEYIDLMPDTSIFLIIKDEGKIKMMEYFDNPKYDNYPLVGIQYEQAIKFCNWRSERVNILNKRFKREEGIQVEYRLPSVDEWDFAARGNQDSTNFPYGIDIHYTKNEKIYPTINCIYPEMTTINYVRECDDTLKNVKPNAFGIYNMIGNICEMVSEKGIAKGGHYESTLANCKIQETYVYQSPNKWLGFRCICIVTSKTVKKENKRSEKK